MKTNIKKLLPIIATSLIGIAQAADSTAQQGKAQQGQKSSAQARSNATVINPPARPTLATGLDFWLDGELLWWKARETGLDFVTVGESRAFTLPAPGAPNPGLSSSANQVTDFSGKVKNPHFHWDFGVRTGFGFNLPFDGWDVGLTWTHLNSKVHPNAVTANPSKQERLFPEYLPFTLPDQNITYTAARPHWRLHFNALDLELGREFFVSRKLTLRPFIGVRAVWIHQKFDVFSHGATGPGQIPIVETNAQGVVTNSFNAVLDNSVRMTNEFDGMGPRVGLDTDWYLGAGFSIYGNAGISLLLGNFDLSYNAVTSANATPVGGGAAIQRQNPISLRESFHDTRAATDLAIGFRWAKKFYDDSFRVRIDLGWDHHIFFGQNQFIAATNNVLPITVTAVGNTVPESSNIESQTLRRGDLSLQGLTLAFRFDF